MGGGGELPNVSRIGADEACGVPFAWAVPLVCVALSMSHVAVARLSGCVMLKRLSGFMLKGSIPCCVAISWYPSARTLVPCVSVDCTGLSTMF